jgi:GT2 family glycosyltransferase
MAEPRITFVVPVRDDAARLRACLEAIAANRLPPGDLEVVVADNGSRDDSATVAREAGATVLELPGLKVSALRNRAASVAGGGVIAFCDADNLIAPSWAETAVGLLADPRAGVVGAPYDPPRPATWVQAAYDAMRDHRAGAREARWLGSGNMALRKSVFAEAGGFDESLETCEDVDLCNRIRRRGHVVLSDRRLASIHLGDPATLGQLFRGELWRGRDNLRVSLREGLGWRDLPSVAVPVAQLALMGAGILGMCLAPVGGLPFAGGAAVAVAVLSVPRAARMIVRGSRRGLAAALQAAVVALTFDVARALALVWRARHHRRRS